jgi:hypothetical protein
MCYSSSRERPRGITVDNIVDSTVMPGRNGGTLRRGGVSGNRGGPGRPTDKYVQLCAKLVSAKECQEAVVAILHDKDHPGFVPLYKLLTERAFGRVKETIDLNARLDAEVVHQPLTILLPMLDRLESAGAGTER